MFTNFDITPCFLFTVLLASNMVQPSKTQACQPSSCQYGGFCFTNGCICPPRLIGPTCTNVVCDNYPCLNGGTCIIGSIPNQDTCHCPDGFVLPFCTTSCLTDVCQNGGTCSDDVCSCSQGFAGPTCQNAIAVYLSPLEVLVTEGDTGNSNIQIHLCRQQSNLPADVTVVTFPDSAITSLDFAMINTPVTIPIGQVCLPVDISIVSDVTFEATEVFHLVIFLSQVPSSVYIVPGQQTATVTIIDNDGTDPPVISNCPFDSSRSTAPGTSSTSVFWVPPTASENSGDVTLTSSHQSGDTFSLGPTTVTYTAVDGAGNTVLCQFVITVMIDIDECSTGSHTCDVMTSECMNTLGTYQCDCNPGYIGDPYYPGIGQTPTCEGTDPPVISNCPFDSSRSTAPGTSSTSVFWVPPTASDNSGDVTLTSSHQSGDTFSLGPTTVTYTAVDGAGNTVLCQFVITVMIDIDECSTGSHTCDVMTSECMNTVGTYQCDCNPGYIGDPYYPGIGQTPTCEGTDPPVISNCPFDSSRSTAPGTSSTSVFWVPPTASDNSGDVTLTSSHQSGDTFSLGPTTVTYTAVDGAGNTVLCQFVITVMIDIDECSTGSHTCDVMTSECMNTVGTYQCDCNPGYIGDPYYPGIGQTPTCEDIDECSIGSHICDAMTSECMNTIGSYRCDCRTGYIGESYFPGQQPTCEADVTPPVISGCPSDIFRTVEIGAPGTTVSWTEPTATDDSGIATLGNQPHSPGSGYLVGTTTVTYRYVDPVGNEAVCTFDIIIQEDCIILNTAGQCGPNECSCTNRTCASQTGRCEATCSVFQCPANIVSESLSQVNPQSSVEIKCILEGSTAVVNRLRIRLSRSEQMIDDHNITQLTAPNISTNRREVTYRVTSVSEDDQFFCILSRFGVTFTAINVTGFVYKLPSISDPPTEITRSTTSVTITWSPWDEETDVGDPPVVAYIPYYKMDPSQDWISGSRIQADQTLEYTASSLESDRNYTFSVAAIKEREGGEGPRGPAVTIKTLCINVVPQMVRTTLSATNDVTVTWQQPTVQCSTGTTQFTIYYEIEGDVSSRLEAGRADPNAESFTVDGSLLEPGTTYNIAVTVTTDQESALSEGSSLTATKSTASEPPSSPVYLVALVIPVLLIIILLVVIIKRIRRKPASESKPVDVQDVDYVNAGVTDDSEDYIALEEQSRNTPAPKYQDLTEKEAPTQVSRYEGTIVETADAAPKAIPRQGIKRQTDYQYEDVNLGETDARKLPSVPQPDLQREDDTEYEVPEMFEEYTGVYINTLEASKPITPRPMKITEYKTFMGRERSKVISEIVQQFMALQTGQQHPWTAAVKLQNKSKNFFKALLPYDHSRVRLDTDGSDVRSDYINASYIKNHQGKVSFIAAQGPREGTKNDFWRMVWKEDVEIIVMLVDKDGTEQPSKGTQYWPDRVKTSEEFCDITVLLMESTAFRTHTVRKMNVLKGNERVHTVRQYEIPCWKYGGVPSESADLTSVIKQIKNHQKGGKHLLVHCSNGVGATGAFIGLYDLMDVIKTKKELSVFDVIEGMRKDRVNMVLTKLQYLFICDALLEAMLSPDSQMPCDQLKKLDLSAMKAKCKKEFQILQETTKHQEDLATLAGNSSENNHKNRFPDLLPVDKFRPVLKSPGNLFGSNDYINATFAKDISQRGFIMTQSPVASIVEDVWRLVFDYDCKCIVMLNTVDDSDESVTVYWPIGHNAATSHGLMNVICKKIDESDVFTRRQFEVKHKRAQKSLLVDHFSFHGWPGKKPDVHKLREFIKYTRTKGTGPALVHCINGVGLSAVYVTVISELERIEKEGAVDVFRTLHRLRKQCPHAVQTQDEYLLCYELLRDHLNNPEEYAVVF